MAKYKNWVKNKNNQQRTGFTVTQNEVTTIVISFPNGEIIQKGVITVPVKPGSDYVFDCLLDQEMKRILKGVESKLGKPLISDSLTTGKVDISLPGDSKNKSIEKLW